MTFRVAEQTNKKKSVEERGAQCKLEAGALLEELKNNQGLIYRKAEGG